MFDRLNLKLKIDNESYPSNAANFTKYKSNYTRLIVKLLTSTKGNIRDGQRVGHPLGNTGRLV